MKIYIAEQAFDHGIARMWQERGHEIVDEILEADVVQFVGGADVNPELYGEKEAIRTRVDHHHDKIDNDTWRNSRPYQLKVGICRGGQFLNVMNGGAMWQHVDGHGTLHGHDITDLLTGKVLRVTSTHHQMMIPHERGELIAFAKDVASNHFTKKDGGRGKPLVDPEVVWYKHTNSLCFQPHPEYNSHPKCREYFFELVDKLYEPKVA